VEVNKREERVNGGEQGVERVAPSPCVEMEVNGERGGHPISMCQNGGEWREERSPHLKRR